MNYTTIKNALKSYNQERVDSFISYLKELETAKKNNGPANTWFSKLNEELLVSMFKNVAIDNLYIDGITIMIGPQRGNIGVIYTYHAYKNKLLAIYPDSTFDIQNVYQGDTFECEKRNGEIIYYHKLANPFLNDPDRGIIGCYCIIKNRLGHFIETLDLAEIDKIRNSSKMSFIWDTWFSEMTLKSVIKRACKRNFNNIVINMDKLDNENYEPNEAGISSEVKKKIENAKTRSELTKIYNDHKLQYKYDKSFVSLLEDRQKQILDEEDMKEPIGEKMLQNAIEEINAGRLTKDEVLDKYNLTDIQLSNFEKSIV